MGAMNTRATAFCLFFFRVFATNSKLTHACVDETGRALYCTSTYSRKFPATLMVMMMMMAIHPSARARNTLLWLVGWLLAKTLQWPQFLILVGCVVAWEPVGTNNVLGR